jgi:hypothetical protein
MGDSQFDELCGLTTNCCFVNDILDGLIRGALGGQSVGFNIGLQGYTEVINVGQGLLEMGYTVGIKQS